MDPEIGECPLISLDPAAELPADQDGEKPGVVDVRMGQQHGIDPFRIERQSLPVPNHQVLQTLEESAIHQQTAGPVPHQELRSGDRAYRPMKLDSQDRTPFFFDEFGRTVSDSTSGYQYGPLGRNETFRTSGTDPVWLVACHPDPPGIPSVAPFILGAA